MATTRCVSILDILGFSQMVRTTSAERLAGRVQRLIAAAEPKKATRVRQTGRGKTRERNLTLGSFHFSDTIVLWTPPFLRRDDDFNFHAFCHLCTTVANLITHALVNDIPLRGGIAVGECHIGANPTVFVGEAIVDAHLVEQAQEWIGAALEAESVLSGTSAEQLEEWAYLVQHVVPVKPDARIKAPIALDWTHLARLPADVTRKLWGLDLGLGVDQALGRGAAAAGGDDSKRKWENAMRFLQIRRQQRPITLGRIHVAVKAV